MKLTPLLLLCLLSACSPRTCEDPADFAEHGALADIEIHYPRSSVRAMTCEIRQDIDAELLQFRQALPAQAPSPNWRYEFKAGTVLHDPRPGLESAEMNIFTFTGGAHPNSKVITLNYAFDKQGWYKLTLPQLFKPGTDWRALLLPAARAAALKLNTDKAWIDRGLEDKDGQWSRFVMDPDALTLIFEPYQVAPYVAGRVRLRMPWESLKGQLNPRWFP